jgi:uncharacterized membrane protein YeiH
MAPSTLLLSLDLLGILVFAVAGALSAVQHDLDVFGVFVLAGVTAVGGGLIRDAVLGATPAAALADWRYLAVTAVAAGVVFFVHPTVAKLGRPLLVLDALGLGLFATAGTQKALRFGLGPLGAIALGVLTAVGGGMVRDVLLGEVPAVLHREVYAIAALLGSVVVVATDAANVRPFVGAIVGTSLCFVVRVVARLRGWSAPTPRKVQP